MSIQDGVVWGVVFGYIVECGDLMPCDGVLEHVGFCICLSDSTKKVLICFSLDIFGGGGRINPIGI